MGAVTFLRRCGGGGVERINGEHGDERRDRGRALQNALASWQTQGFLAAFRSRSQARLSPNPVQAKDGHTHGRKAIQRWLRGNNTSPLTCQRISLRVHTNFIAKQLLDEWKSKQAAVKANSVMQHILCRAGRAGSWRD